jgi:hypothetical protein
MAKVKTQQAEQVEQSEVELNEDGLAVGVEISSGDLLQILAAQRLKANGYEATKEDDAS